MGTRKGLTRVGPLLSMTPTCSDRVMIPPDPARNHDGDPVPVAIRYRRAGGLKRLQGSRRGELDEAVHPPRLLAVYVGRWVEVGYFGCYLSIEPVGVEGRYSSYSRLSFEEVRPSGGGVKPEGAYHADPGHCHATVHGPLSTELMAADSSRLARPLSGAAVHYSRMRPASTAHL